MNVLILTPDRVGSTLLQRVLTVYMLRKGFDKPVINLHELTNGLEKYYNEILSQEVLGKPKGTQWGYYQTLLEIETLLKSIDHYKTTRLAHYHIVNRQDSMVDQLKFYEYLNDNFFIIGCRRENLFEHALSWGIQGHSKKLNVYNAEEKINSFYNIYKNKITIPEQTITNYLNKYKEYINWSDSYFNVQSYWNYDTDIKDIEKYVLNLDFMHGSESNSWYDMFGQDFDTWNTCHRMLPNLLLNRANATQIEFSNSKEQHNSPLWLQHLTEFVKNQTLIPTGMSNQVEHAISITNEEFKFLDKNIQIYQDINSKMVQLVKDGFLVTGIPLKLQSLKEKKFVINNFDQCIQWYNNWVEKNNFGKLYSDSDLDSLMIQEDQQLNFSIDQQNLLQ
jgi:hypothetical protein